jgi:ubiquinone/menaquinone biosynthesis C-methylase UbiE
MTALELLVDFHKNAERQGPGSNEDTLKALSFIDVDQQRPLRVADIGCGTGAQTMVLAQHLNAQITAVDLFPEFLAQLTARAERLGLHDNIRTLQASMDDLPFDREAFDIIWSEGAVYIIGFEEGVKKWKSFLKPGGYLAISEITWTTQLRPPAIEAYWNKEYPQIDVASSKMKVLEDHGFSPVGYFYLPESSWINHYYQPIANRMDAFLAQHNHTELAKEIVAAERKEISTYRTYKDFLSYGFYVARKVT